LVAGGSLNVFNRGTITSGANAISTSTASTVVNFGHISGTIALNLVAATGGSSVENAGNLARPFGFMRAGRGEQRG
jgi:hypothetical protein